MGALSDKANQQSKFVIIEKCQQVVLRYEDFRFVPSQRDPTVEVVMYRFNQDGREKFWTNGSSRIMRFMDNVAKGSWVRITRADWINKDGSTDKTKSTYTVEEIDHKGVVLRGSGDSLKEADNAQP